MFFYFVKKVWSEDIALFVAVLFPYMDFWSYYGLGMMVCSAALLYVKKNSYMHAVILWLAFFWCAVYRLDLGFAFGIAVIVSMIVYVISERNMTAFRQLGLTLIGFGVICGIIWSFLCMIKGINPLGRLIEFLMLSMSNQNWAYTDIGDSSSSVFSWIYAIIPFTVIICTVYTVFSKDMKARIGCGKWMLLMVLGFSYFANFSRGLVRHSLAEGLGDVVIWSSYLFLAMFLSCLKNNNRLLLPVFMFLILCNTLFTENGRVNSIPIADMAVSRPSAIIESWKINRFDEEEYDELKLEQDRFIAKGEVINENDRVDDSLMSYWQKVKNSQEVVERVRFDDEFMDMVNSYAFILDVLLDENDTFVDFANKTLLYSVFGRENPVYISQSPLQLSGDFSQEQFIKEIRGIPVVLMPLDPNNAYESCTLDNIANAYRNYKVSEYIYQQYVPLCKYEDKYAVWCLRDRYQEYRERMKGQIEGTEYLEKLADCAGMVKNEDGTCTMRFLETEPAVCELQNVVDLDRFEGEDMLISVTYSTDTSGVMQIFYTTEKGENYTAQKVISTEINGTGSAEFLIPVTEYTHLCLTVPGNSTVTFLSFVAKCNVCDYINYGYDGPVQNADEYGSFSYISALHNYNIVQIPGIWAEEDTRDSTNNQVLTELTDNNGLYTIDVKDIGAGENGNYLKISAVYDGNDTGGLYQDDDELLPVTVIAGNYENGQFSEKCRFAMILTEGRHDYLIRISADYYWYLKEINAVQIQERKVLRDVTMQILEGD